MMASSSTRKALAPGILLAVGILTLPAIRGQVQEQFDDQPLVTTGMMGPPRGRPVRAAVGFGEVPFGGDRDLLQWQLALAGQERIKAGQAIRDAELDVADAQRVLSAIPKVAEASSKLEHAKNSLECARRLEAHWSREAERLEARLNELGAPRPGPAGEPGGRPESPQANPGAGGARFRPLGMAPAPMPMDAGPAAREIAPARFEATVYEVVGAEDRLAALQASALETKAATAQDLAKALGEFGTVRVLHKIDQTVNLHGESIVLGTREPMISGSSIGPGGRTVNSVTYQETGLRVNLSASTAPEGPANKVLSVQVNFELSVLAESGIEIAPQAKASSIRRMDLRHSEAPRFGKPLVLLQASAPGAAGKTPAAAYVIRYLFGEMGR